MNNQEKRIHTYENLFIHRKDVHARQRPDGRYFLRMSPVNDEVIKAHLEGKITAGWYALDQASTAKWAVLDADSADGIERLQSCFRSLDQLGVPSYLEQSRRGGHLWIFLERPIPGEGVRQLVSAALPDLGSIEVFPKQDSLDGKKVGSLIRGPLGTHQLSGGRYPFLDPLSLKPLARTTLTTIDALMDVERLSVKRASEIISALQVPQNPSQEPGAPLPPVGGEQRQLPSSPIEQAKETLGDPYAFIAQYVDLDASGKAHCPFHPPDHHKSFALNRATGKWTDFHEFHPETKSYGGGDALDFYAKVKGVTLKEAIRELLK